MADIYSDLELVNNAVQEAGVGDKRNRNNAIRKGLENPGVYRQAEQPSSLSTTLSSIGTQPTQESPWTAPSSWGQYGYDNQEKQNASLVRGMGYDPEGQYNPETTTVKDLGGKTNTLDQYQKEAQDMGELFRSKGFIPGASGGGWTWNEGLSAPGTMKHNEDAKVEEGGGYWNKQNPAGYKGIGEDYIWYSPSQGYQTSQYIKQAPKEHGVGGFLKSPGGMMLLSLLGAGLGAGGLGGLFGAGEAAAAGGIGSLEGALGAAGGMSVAPGVASSGLVGSLGLSPAMSLVPGGAAMAGVASGALGSGGLLGKGGILGTGLDTGSSLANTGIENFGKSLVTSGGDIKKSGINALSGAASSGLGGLFDSDISKYISSMSKPLLSSALSGGTLQSGIQNSLFGGAAAGLGNLLNSTDLMSGNTQEKNALANNTVSLAKTLSRKRKVA